MRYSFDELTLIPQRRYKRKKFEKKENRGLDTETYKGKAHLICDDAGRYKIIKSFLDILQFLTHSRFRTSFNWFFNIKFDFEALIKWLPLDVLQWLYAEKSILWEGYTISYLDKKFLKIIDQHNHSFVFYDINNFLNTSLNSASKQYLGEEKYDKIDSARLNRDKDYWKGNLPEIIHYCSIDAKLTKEVADHFWNMLEQHIHFLPAKPYSKGAYSQEYFLEKCNIPPINKLPDKVLKYAYNSYSGGRFELLKRGFFEHAHIYDIKSAYPFQMAKLPNYNLGTWRETKELQEGALSGFYLCNVEHIHFRVSPFMQKISGLNVYPNGEFEQYLTQNEIETILKLFPDTDITVKSGYYFEENCLDFPLQEEILKLYKWKETEKDKDIRYCVKIILNSLYGKFIQTVGGRTGRIFNPIWASEITANTRLMLISSSISNIENIIGYSTDSIHSQVPLQFYPKEFCGTTLGNWDDETEGKGLYIQSDVYSIDTGHGIKTRYRGFNLEKMEDIEDVREEFSLSEEQKVSLFEILQMIHDDVDFSYVTSRPLHLGEILMQVNKRQISDLNIWENIEKKISINGDVKRIWERDFKNGNDALEHNICSHPIFL